MELYKEGASKSTKQAQLLISWKQSLSMESVRLLKRKAKEKRHFINCENMVEVLPSTSTYKGHTTNFQDDWPTTTSE